MIPDCMIPDSAEKIKTMMASMGFELIGETLDMLAYRKPNDGKSVTVFYKNKD